MQSKSLPRRDGVPRSRKPPRTLASHRQVALDKRRSRRLVGRSPQSPLQFVQWSSSHPLAALIDAIAWLSVAIVFRLLLESFMAISSQFWILGMTVSITPAIAAMWMTTTSPRLGWILGYRCLLIMVGLLLGGKLGGFA